MPAKEIYGAQPPIELLRQWIDHHHWYDKKDTSRLDIEDVLFMSAMGPPGGGRNDITGKCLILNAYNNISLSQFLLSHCFVSFFPHRAIDTSPKHYINRHIWWWDSREHLHIHHRLALQQWFWCLVLQVCVESVIVKWPEKIYLDTLKLKNVSMWLHYIYI